jgi:hypothetical protein
MSKRLLVLCFLLIAIPSLAQTSTAIGACNPAGAWYGGSPDVKYMLTIIQDPGGNYTMIGSASFTQASLGYPVTTPFTTSIVKRPGNRLEFFGTGMVNSNGGFPAPNPELWALHGTARMTSCDSLQLDYDFFGGYFMPTDKKPFLSSPDYVVVPPPFSETYTKMPTTCTQCGQ